MDDDLPFYLECSGTSGTCSSLSEVMGDEWREDYRRI